LETCGVWEIFGKNSGICGEYLGNLWETMDDFFLGGHRGATYQYHVKKQNRDVPGNMIGLYGMEQTDTLWSTGNLT
jgi:hypothetical protein